MRGNPRRKGTMRASLGIRKDGNYAAVRFPIVTYEFAPEHKEERQEPIPADHIFGLFSHVRLVPNLLLLTISMQDGIVRASWSAVLLSPKGLLEIRTVPGLSVSVFVIPDYARDVVNARPVTYNDNVLR